MPAKSETEPKTEANEVMKALRRKRIEEMALYLSRPDMPKVNGVVDRTAFEVGFEIVYGKEIDAPSESLKAYYDRRKAIRMRAISNLGKFIRAVISPRRYPADEATWAGGLFERIKTQNSNLDMAPQELYAVLGIEPWERPKSSSTSKPVTSPLAAPSYSAVTTLSGSSTGPKPEPKSDISFLDHLLDMRDNPLEPGAFGSRHLSEPPPPRATRRNSHK